MGKTISWQVILPSKFRKEIIEELHGGATGGHFGVMRTMAKVKARYKKKKFSFKSFI